MNYLSTEITVFIEIKFYYYSIIIITVTAISYIVLSYVIVSLHFIFLLKTDKRALVAHQCLCKCLPLVV